jgi:MFS family permease
VIAVVPDRAPRWASDVSVLVIAVILGMSPWFSATVVGAAMVREWGAPESAAVWLTLSVQFGFVVGSLVSARFVLSDRWSPRRLAAWSALLAALVTALLTTPQIPFGAALGLRVVCGMALAGVYPPGIKLAAGWTRERRGMAIGVLVGGTTLGSAVPHLLPLMVESSDWRGVLWLASLCAGLGALLFAARVREGPFQAPSAPLDPRAIGLILRNPRVMRATGGYLGHMWELYAMWSSIGAFWAMAALRYGWSTALASVASFSTVAAGAIGCVYAGWAADRMSRSTVTIAAMALSGTCALTIGYALEAAPIVPLVVALIWGCTVVADSAQFSAAVTEAADANYVGTAVTIQTALGFLLTMVTIELVPRLSAAWGWRWAYAPLALGPLVGIVSMLAFRRLEAPRRGAEAHASAR